MLNTRIVGQGKPVVFLHGFLETLEMWQVIDENQLNCQCIFIDLPGHGKSKELPADSSITSMAIRVFETLESLEISDYYLVGHSMGGYVALEMAQLNSDIEKVCLVNSNFWEDTEQRKKDRNRILTIIGANKNRFLKEAIPSLYARPSEHAEFIEMTYNLAEPMSMEAIQFATIAIRDRKDQQIIADLLGENLFIVQGELDLSVPLETMLQKTTKKKYSLHIIENVGHMVHVEATKDLMAILEAFIH